MSPWKKTPKYCIKLSEVRAWSLSVPWMASLAFWFVTLCSDAKGTSLPGKATVQVRGLDRFYLKDWKLKGTADSLQIGSIHKMHVSAAKKPASWSWMGGGWRFLWQSCHLWLSYCRFPRSCPAFWVSGKTGSGGTLLTWLSKPPDSSFGGPFPNFLSVSELL